MENFTYVLANTVVIILVYGLATNPLAASEFVRNPQI